MTPLQERAAKALKRLVKHNTTIYTQKIDNSRKSQKSFYSVMVIDGNEIVNIAGYMASLFEKRHSTDIWPNSQGIELQSEMQAIELLGQHLFDAYHAADLAEHLGHRSI